MRHPLEADGLVGLPKAREVDPVRQLQHQFIEHVHGQIAVCLQILDGFLPRAQGRDFLFNIGNFGDLLFKDGCFTLDEVVAFLLVLDHVLEPEINATGDQQADDGRQQHDGLKRLTAALARGFAVREQVDQYHCRNLRMARPHAVR